MNIDNCLMTFLNISIHDSRKNSLNIIQQNKITIIREITLRKFELQILLNEPSKCRTKEKLSNEARKTFFFSEFFRKST